MQRAIMGPACALAALLLAGGAYAQPANQNDNGYTNSAPDQNNPDQNNALQNSGYNGPDQGNYNEQNTYEENNAQNPDENGANYSQEPNRNVNDQMTNGESAEYNENPGAAENNPPAGSFYLTSNEQSEIADFTSNRDMSVCLSRHGTQTRLHARRQSSVPLNISWNGNSAMVYPGNCLYFDASHVTVRPAEQLPPGVALRGRIETYGSYENTR